MFQNNPFSNIHGVQHGQILLYMYGSAKMVLVPIKESNQTARGFL